MPPADSYLPENPPPIPAFWLGITWQDVRDDPGLERYWRFVQRTYPEYWTDEDIDAFTRELWDEAEAVRERLG